MLKALLGQKLNMSQMYDTHGRATAVTEILVQPNLIVVLKEKEKDGYKAAQIGFGASKKVGKPLAGHFKKAGIKTSPARLREVEFDGDLSAGAEISVEQVFHKGSMVDVVGKSKGKGFAGVIKRWGFHGGPKTHGQSDRHRAPGSIGSGTTPGRVQKGLKMAGHLGADQVSVFGLEVMGIDKETGKILLKGSVPGPTGGLLVLKKSKKKKEVYHEPEIPAQPALGGSDEPKGEAEVGEENKTEEAAQISSGEEKAPE